MSVFENFKQAPSIRPLLNMGCLLDIPTGHYLTGKHGESILNGGLSNVTGIGGRGNTYKSTLAHFMLLRSMDRYPSAYGLIYDTEMSLTWNRIESLMENTPRLQSIGVNELQERGQLFLTDKVSMMGEQWFTEFRNLLKARGKNKKAYQLTTPFIDRGGNPVVSFSPLVAELDSISNMSIDVVEEMYDKSGIGDSKLNTEAMKGAAAKSQMMLQLPSLTTGYGGYLIITAHIGDQKDIDPYAPPSKKLVFLKGKISFKRAPENFTFLTGNCWYCSHLSVLNNQKTKQPEFPLEKQNDHRDNNDLMCVTIQNLRAKNGPSGLPLDLVVSQSNGVEPSMTEFYYLKQHDRFGLGGNNEHYFLELCPDIALSRTKVRGKIRQYPELRRALEIVSELCQMTLLWQDVEPDLLCDAKTLYEEIKAKGYDWSILLDTRGYWMFEEDAKNHPQPFLSTLDLLNMRLGRYHPWWYDKQAKKK